MKQKKKKSVLDSHAFINLEKDMETLTRTQFETQSEKLESTVLLVHALLPGVFKEGKSRIIYDRQEDEWTAQLFFVHTEENIQVIGTPTQLTNSLYEMIRKGLS